MEKTFIRCHSKSAQGGPAGNIIQGLLGSLMDLKTVDAFLAFTEKKPGSGMQAISVDIATDSSRLDQSLLSQFIVCGLPRLLSIPKVIHSQLGGCFDRKMAVVAHPCEIRALVELSKRHQVALDNLFIIGLQCPGTLPVSDFIGAIRKSNLDPSKIEFCEMTPKGLTVKCAGKILSLRVGPDVKLRDSCYGCGNREPVISDITMSTLGEESLAKTVLARADTARGKNCIEHAANGGILGISGNLSQAETEQNRSIVRGLEEQAAGKFAKGVADFVGLGAKERFAQFSAAIEPCTKCGLCVRACPVCWCKDCILLKKIKTIDPMVLHVTRMLHMADTCVNCGKCDENCPKAIKLSKIYYGLASELGKTSGYRPGLILDQPSSRSAKVILSKK